MRRLSLFTLIVILAFVTLAGCESGQDGSVTSQGKDGSRPIVSDSRSDSSSTDGSSLDSKTSEGGTATPNATAPANIEEFNPDDGKAAGIRLDMEKSEVERILGNPQRKESQYEDAFGCDVYTYYYDFGRIRLEPLDDDKYAVSNIIIEMPGYEGPRSIRVGDSVDHVLDKFPVSKESEVDQGGRRFLYGKGDENCGYIVYDSEGKPAEIYYLYGGGGFGSYSLWMKISDNRVESIAVGVTNI